MDILNQLSITPALLITQIIGFLILMVVLHRVFTTKVFGILDERRDSIKGAYDQLDADRAAMEDLRRQYEQRLAGIEAEARAKIQEAVKEAQALRDNLVADARQQAGTIIEQGRNDMRAGAAAGVSGNAPADRRARRRRRGQSGGRKPQ